MFGAQLNRFLRGRSVPNEFNMPAQTTARGRKALVQRLQAMGLTQKESETAVETILEKMIEGLEKDGKILVSGFGKFEIRQRRPRNSRLPGQELKRIPARRTVHFKAAPEVFKRLKQR